MTAAALNTLINLKCSTNDTTFPVADKLVYVKIFMDEIAGMIIDRDIGYFLVPSTFDLVADQREYAIGNDMLNRIQRLELKFVAADSRFPSRAIKDYQGSETESEIVKTYSNSKDCFAHTIRRRALFILSGTIANCTAGGRIWVHTFPATLANLTDNTNGLEVDPSTTTFGFPRQLQELLARRVAIEYKGSQPKPLALNAMEINYERDLKKVLDAMTPIDNSLETMGELPDAAYFGNNGQDY